MCPGWLTDHDISKSNIVVLAPNISPNADHETEFDRKASLHIARDNTSRTDAHDTCWKASDDDVVDTNTAEGIIVIITFILLQPRMYLVQQKRR